MATDIDIVDDFDEAISGGSDTCLGPPTDLLCRDVGEAGSNITHAVSIRYNADYWYVRAGARNVFDEPPPEVDGTEVFAINNTPIGAGYDLSGRILFLNAGIRMWGR